MGFLGGIHISVLLARVALSHPPEGSAWNLVKGFFETYASYDWSRDIAALPNVGSNYRRTGREAMVILSPERPVVNVAASATVPSVETISEELRTAQDMLQAESSWRAICRTFEANIGAFRKTFDVFIKVDISYWGGSCMEARALIGFVESRLPHVSYHSVATELAR